MYLTVVQKHINEQYSHTNEKFQQGTRHFRTHKCVGIAAFDAAFNNIERQQRHQCQHGIAYQ